MNRPYRLQRHGDRHARSQDEQGSEQEVSRLLKERTMREALKHEAQEAVASHISSGDKIKEFETSMRRYLDFDHRDSNT